MSFVVTTFYKFYETVLDTQSVASLQLRLYKLCKDVGMLGTIIVGTEGVNATLTGASHSMDKFYSRMGEIAELANVAYTESFCAEPPFKKLKVKIKDEIVKLGIDELDGRRAGVRLKPKEWEALLDSGALVIDTRNFYEVAFGTFKNAVNPHTHNFTDVVKWLEDNLSEEYKEKPIGMFCTGGVRCEKSTAYLVEKGFKKVYHLEGGILKYLQDAERKREYWKGKCFVFDNRVAVDHDLKPYAEE